MDITSFFSAEGGPIWIKFRRLVQNDMSTTCHIAGCNNSIRHIENRFSPYFIFLNAVWALTSGGFRIVSDTLVLFCVSEQRALKTLVISAERLNVWTRLYSDVNLIWREFYTRTRNYVRAHNHVKSFCCEWLADWVTDMIAVCSTQ